MRVEEIALRQEIRQMLSEVGLDNNTLREMAKDVLREEIEKQVKCALTQSSINSMVYSSMNTYEFKQVLRQAIKDEVRDAIEISIDVKAKVQSKDEQSSEDSTDN